MIRVGRRKAFFRYGTWRSANKELEQSLNELTRSWLHETGGPPLRERDQELLIAKEIARQTGGRLGSHTPGNSRQLQEFLFRQRQLVLSFDLEENSPLPDA
jgi:hypothetical protein